jgi:hypothetical protein
MTNNPLLFNCKGGAGLLNRYDDSLVKTLNAIYPNSQWPAWRLKNSGTSHPVVWEASTSAGFINSLAHFELYSTPSLDKLNQLCSPTLDKESRKRTLRTMIKNTGSYVKVPASKRQLYLHLALKRLFPECILASIKYRTAYAIRYCHWRI